MRTSHPLILWRKALEVSPHQERNGALLNREIHPKRLLTTAPRNYQASSRSNYQIILKELEVLEAITQVLIREIVKAKLFPSPPVIEPSFHPSILKLV